jgi:hypothetical protein
MPSNKKRWKILKTVNCSSFFLNLSRYYGATLFSQIFKLPWFRVELADFSLQCLQSILNTNMSLSHEFANQHVEEIITEKSFQIYGDLPRDTRGLRRECDNFFLFIPLTHKITGCTLGNFREEKKHF